MSDSSSIAWFGLTRLQMVCRLRELADELEMLSIPEYRSLTRLDDWALTRRAVPCLIGVPTNHPTVSDGKSLLSSELFYFDPQERIARSFSRWYQLGSQVDPVSWAQDSRVQ